MALTLSIKQPVPRNAGAKLPQKGPTMSTTRAPTMGVQAPAPNPIVAAPPVQPLDPIAEARKAANQRTYGDVSANINNDEGRIKQQYGFDDTSDPFSRLAVLRQSYQNRQRGTENSMAARGQLYSGANLNQQAIDTRAYDESYHGLRGGYGDALSAVARKRQAARSALDQGTIDAEADALNRAIDTRADPSELPPTDAGQAPAAPRTLSPAAAARRKGRAKAGVNDTRGLSPAAVARLRKRGLLPG